MGRPCVHSTDNKPEATGVCMCVCVELAPFSLILYLVGERDQCPLILVLHTLLEAPQASL